MRTDDPLAGLAGFARSLAEAGLAVSATRTASYLEALRQLDFADPSAVYWAGRLTICAQPDDLPRYDRAFAAWFGALPVRPAMTGNTARVHTVRAPADRHDGGADQHPQLHLRVAADDSEVLRHKDIRELTPAELANLNELLARLRPQPPTRPAYRRRPAHRGALDADRTLRAMLRTGGEPVRLEHASGTDKPRKLVLLLDISGSMAPYADVLLRFAHVVARGCPTEVFALGTRMTRLTRQLRARDPELALAAAGKAVPDWAGGTRLGDTVRAFTTRWGRRGCARGAVLVIFSDGWERGSPDLLAEQLRQLKLLAHKVFWVNPHAGKPGYAPVQSGVAAALPHLDKLLAGHSLATLRRLLDEVRDA